MTLSTRIVVTGLLVVTAWGCCHRSAEDEGWRRRAAELRATNVVREVGIAMSRGDYRAVGVMGVGTIVPAFPGWENGWVKSVRDHDAKHGLRIIDGTSDAVIGDAHLDFQHAAFEYAQRYNTELLKRMAEDGDLIRDD